MSSGEYESYPLEGAPDFLRTLGLKAVYFPRQDGCREHYALLDMQGGEVFACGDIENFVKEAEKRKI